MIFAEVSSRDLAGEAAGPLRRLGHCPDLAAATVVLPAAAGLLPVGIPLRMRENEGTSFGVFGGIAIGIGALLA
jgi:hypothetical protein